MDLITVYLCINFFFGYDLVKSFIIENFTLLEFSQISVVFWFNYWSSLSTLSIILLKMVFWRTQRGTPIGYPNWNPAFSIDPFLAKMLSWSKFIINYQVCHFI